MARQTHTAVAAPGKWPTAGATLNFVAANVANKEQTLLTGRELVIARNSGATARTVTINSVPDPYNRVRDITAESLAAGATHIFGPFDIVGWRQADGMLYFEASHAEVLFAVVRLPG